MTDSANVDSTNSDGAGQASDGLDWNALFDAAPAKVIRSHPRVAGIIGSELAARLKEANPPKAETPPATPANKPATDDFGQVDQFLAAFQTKLRPDVQEALKGKVYNGDPVSARLAFVDEALTLTATPTPPSKVDVAAQEAFQRGANRQANATSFSVGSEPGAIQIPNKDQLRNMSVADVMQMSDADLAVALA